MNKGNLVRRASVRLSLAVALLLALACPGLAQSQGAGAPDAGAPAAAVADEAPAEPDEATQAEKDLGKDIAEGVDDATKVVKKTFTKAANSAKRVGKEVVKALSEEDADFYMSHPCKFQIVDKLGRAVQTTSNSELAFQLQPGENGRYLNGKREIEIDTLSLDTNTWLSAEPVGTTGVFSVDLLVPVAEDSNAKATYNVRFAGDGNLAANSLNTSSVTVTNRGTAHDVEILSLGQEVRQNWELPLAGIGALLALGLGWFKAARLREKTFEELTKNKIMKAKTEADGKFRKVMVWSFLLVLAGMFVVIFFPGVQGFFPYCGVWLGSLLPFVLVLLLC